MPKTVSAAELFEELQESSRQFELDGQTFWIVEGDLALNETQLLAYAFRHAAAAATEPREGLVGMTDDQNRIIRWRQGLALTYTIQKNTFSGAEQYQKVVAAMHAATADWEATCGVHFEHVTALDDSLLPATGQTLFYVRAKNTGGQLIAAAFFPTDPPDRRFVIIDPSFFKPDLGYDPAGVLRHELGHVLGFRHEHIRSGAPPVCPGESTAFTVNLGDYDPQSVMHYFCGGVGSKDLLLTEVDRQGARLVYGPPDHEVTYCE